MKASRKKPFVLRSASWIGAILVASLAGCTRGTGPAPPPAISGAPTQDGHYGHNHDHSHQPLGPHGGHVVDLRSADGTIGLHAEWLHEDEQNRVVVFLTDPKTDQPPPDCPDSITIQVRAGKEPRTYTLPKVATWKGAPVAGAYELVDPTLVTALKISVEGSEPLISIHLAQQHYQGIITHDEHDH